jgi:hypothetical protein
MNLNDTLDPQIADTLLRRPSLDDLSRFVAGLATPIEAELIEAHMQRSPKVRKDVEALQRDLDTFSESLHQSLQEQENVGTSLRIVTREIAPREENLPSSETTKPIIVPHSNATSFQLTGHKSKRIAVAASHNDERHAVRFFDNHLTLPDGLGGNASASTEAPLLCSTLRITQEGSATQEPQDVYVSWPRGKRRSLKWEWKDSSQKWRTDVVLPEPWPEVSNWIVTGELIISI